LVDVTVETEQRPCLFARLVLQAFLNKAMEGNEGNNDVLMSEEVDVLEEYPSADITSESAIRIQRLHAVEKVSTTQCSIILFILYLLWDSANSSVNPDIWQCYCCTF
jgi:hypothetical protein